MTDLSKINCPDCGKTSLKLGTKLVAKPVGTWSLAGVQSKVVATETPAIVCGGCNFYKLPSN